MEKRTLPKRDAVIIVVLVHIGIVLLWVSMGGCGDSTTRERNDMGTPGPDDVETLDNDTAFETVEPDVSVAEEITPADDEATGTIEAANEVRYVVKSGDSLWEISRKFGVTVDAIADRNDIRDRALIRVGRELWIPNPTKGLDEASTETSTSTADTGAAEPTTGETATGETGTGETGTGDTTTPAEPVDLGTIETFDYEVQPGDTIWKLARTHHTTTKIIMELNGITDPKKMRAGDTIRIPKPAGE